MSDFTPQVETREIADSDLDNVAGGVLGVNVYGTVAPLLGTVEGTLPAPVTGVLNQVTGLVPANVSGILGQ